MTRTPMDASLAVSLDAIRLGVGIALLAYGSWTDWRTRRVPNLTWIVGGTLALVLFLYDAVLLRGVPAVYALLALVLIGLAYLIWRGRLMGGADAKALMVLAVLAPTPVALATNGTTLPWWPGLLPPSFATYANSLVAFLVVPFAFLAWNLAKGERFSFACFVGYRMRLTEARKRFVWIMDQTDDDGNVHLQYFPGRVTPEEHEANADRLAALGHEKVWVTPKFPHMIPLLVGFIAAFTLGDLLTHFVVEPLLRIVAGT